LYLACWVSALVVQWACWRAALRLTAITRAIDGTLGDSIWSLIGFSISS
jgi:hypothetical protein